MPRNRNQRKIFCRPVGALIIFDSPTPGLRPGLHSAAIFDGWLRGIFSAIFQPSLRKTLCTNVCR